MFFYAFGKFLLVIGIIFLTEYIRRDEHYFPFRYPDSFILSSTSLYFLLQKFRNYIISFITVFLYGEYSSCFITLYLSLFLSYLIFITCIFRNCSSFSSPFSLTRMEGKILDSLLLSPLFKLFQLFITLSKISH